MMIRSLCVLFIALLVAMPHAYAQNCARNFEEIVPLRAPDIGAYNVWDAIHGEDTVDERYVSGFKHENNHIIAAGERVRIQDDYVRLILTEFDRRGRPVWDKTHSITGLFEVVKAFSYGDGFVVLGNKKNKDDVSSGWIGFFNFEGGLRFQGVLRADSDSIVARDLIARPKGGLILLVSVMPERPAAKPYSIVYRLDTKGQVVSKRSYQPGLENALMSLTVVPDEDAYYAGGYVNDAVGRKTGWLVKLGGDGTLMWQRQIPRGSGAQVLRVASYGEDSLIAAGNAVPIGDGAPDAGWVLKLDGASGDVIWHRYFTGDYNYIARDLMVSDDGLITVLLDGDPVGEVEGQPEMKDDYVRLLVLNPRGTIFDSAHYFNGEGTDAFALIRGFMDERVIVGASDMAYTLQDESDEISAGMADVQRSREGWMVAVPAMDSYNDPCE